MRGISCVLGIEREFPICRQFNERANQRGEQFEFCFAVIFAEIRCSFIKGYEDILTERIKRGRGVDFQVSAKHIIATIDDCLGIHAVDTDLQPTKRIINGGDEIGLTLLSASEWIVDTVWRCGKAARRIKEG